MTSIIVLTVSLTLVILFFVIAYGLLMINLQKKKEERMFKDIHLKDGEIMIEMTPEQYNQLLKNKVVKLDNLCGPVVLKDGNEVQ